MDKEEIRMNEARNEPCKGCDFHSFGIMCSKGLEPKVIRLNTDEIVDWSCESFDNFDSDW